MVVGNGVAGGRRLWAMKGQRGKKGGEAWCAWLSVAARVLGRCREDLIDCSIFRLSFCFRSFCFFPKKKEKFLAALDTCSMERNLPDRW